MIRLVIPILSEFCPVRDFRPVLITPITSHKKDTALVQDNKATVEAEWSWKGFNLGTLKEDSGKQKRIVSLVKENGSGKITQWRRLKQSEQ